MLKLKIKASSNWFLEIKVERRSPKVIELLDRTVRTPYYEGGLQVFQ